MLFIGNTPLIRLERLSGPGCAEIYVKYEGSNPTCSMKAFGAELEIFPSENGKITAKLIDSMIERANVWAAIQRARIIGSGKKIVTVICDSGLKYLNGDLYR